jgi:hypothetical protein
MRSRIRVLVLLVVAAVLPACGNQSETPGKDHTQAGTPPASAPGHAAADVVPGSYEDWCGEHAVPESMCTRCNPALVAAFKATNDWCVEHGLPESQCLICNPNLVIVRPPKPEGK